MIQALTRCAAVALLAIVAGCGGEQSGPEEQVRAWVDAMHEAAENKDRRTILDGIADGYADARGNSKDDIGDMLRVYFLRQGTIVLIVNIDEIEIVGGSAANVALTVGMAGTGGGTLGLSADAYRFELELEADGDDWQLLSAAWGEIGQPVR
ncbi:MAG: hypothetical protein QNJ00_01045 [Woeseiaceae bacterium]|nr:hypothetical protein [Woeseiaceae bacterium]